MRPSSVDSEWQNQQRSESGVEPRCDVGSRRRRIVAQLQGVFYFVSGIWPLLHLRSFLAVTGPKTDLWLVQTVGALLAVIGATLALGARRRDPDAVWGLLGAASALVLALVDVVFVTRNVIPPIYLADAAVEAIVVAAWGWAFFGPCRRSKIS